MGHLHARQQLTHNQRAKLTQIASDVAGISTLEQRGADGLDFHDISVWNLEEMLARAYFAGQESK